MISIGQEIERVFKANGMQPKVFAERIGTSPRNLYNIFSRDTIDTNLLQRISSVLQYDFFKLFKSESENIVLEPEGDYNLQKKIVVKVEMDEETKELLKLIFKNK